MDKDELKFLKVQLIDLEVRKIKHVMETCKFFRRLSGETISGYARLIGVSHTYWKDLESGIRSNPSEQLKERIASVSGLSYDTVRFIFDNDQLEIKSFEKLIIGFLEQYIQEKIQIDSQHINKNML